MKNKKGFTIAGLLLAIILVSLVIFYVIPTLKNNTSETKEFTEEINKIYKAITVDDTHDKYNIGFTNASGCVSLEGESLRIVNVIHLDVDTKLRFYAEMDGYGNIVKFYAYDDNYQIAYKGSNFKLLDVSKTSITKNTKRDFNLEDDSYNDGIISKEELKKYCDYEIEEEVLKTVDKDGNISSKVVRQLKRTGKNCTGTIIELNDTLCLSY